MVEQGGEPSNMTLEFLLVMVTLHCLWDITILRIGFFIYVLKMKKLRFRETQNLPRVLQFT